jgi:hypothetical protein
LHREFGQPSWRSNAHQCENAAIVLGIKMNIKKIMSAHISKSL